MNRKYTARTPTQANIWKQAVLIVFFNVAWFALPGLSVAQYTIDGTNCVVFSDMFDGELARCVKYQADGSTLKISLIGKRPNTVARIELSKNGLAPFQVVNTAVQPTIDHQNVGLILADMNFDQHIDFAVMKVAQTKSHTSYLYFIFDPQTGRFAPNAGLSKLHAPVFDAKTESIISHWRQGSNKNRRDLHIWRNGNLVLIRRVERVFSGKECQEHTYENKNGALLLTKTEACAD